MENRKPDILLTEGNKLKELLHKLGKNNIDNLQNNIHTSRCSVLRAILTGR